MISSFLMHEKMTFYNPVDQPKADWSEYTLIMPCLGVGNVGQLAVDLLISTLIDSGDCHLVGRISSKTIKSVVGPNAYQYTSRHIMTGCEVYESEPHKLVIIQQRSPAFQRKRLSFVDEMTEWIKNSNFKQVYVLASGFAIYLHSALVNQESMPIRFLSVGIPQNKIQQEFNLKEAEKTKCAYADNVEPSLEIQGSYCVKAFYNKWQTENIKALFLIQYCSEGDNIPESVNLLDTLANVLALRKTETSWKRPISWSQLYGDDTPVELY